MRYDCLGDAMLFNADCRDVMCLLPRVQAVVTDPPYGIKYKTKYRQVMDTPAMLVGDDSAPLWSVGRKYATGAHYTYAQVLRFLTPG